MASSTRIGREPWASQVSSDNAADSDGDDWDNLLPAPAIVANDDWDQLYTAPATILNDWDQPSEAPATVAADNNSTWDQPPTAPTMTPSDWDESDGAPATIPTAANDLWLEELSAPATVAADGGWGATATAQNGDAADSASSNSNNEDLRKISICPTIDDIHRSDVPFLMPNRIEEAYESVEQYLQTQFGLLREDLVRQLVDSITKYSLEGDAAEFEVPMYHDIQFIHTIERFGMFEQVASFDMQRLSHVNWAESSRLLPGSLIVFSSNNFKTMFFGVVSGQRSSKFPDHMRIKIEGSYRDFYSNLGNKKFVAIESIGYFESYRHALYRVQKYNEETLPFRQYLCDPVGPDQNRPTYLCGDEKYDLSSIIDENAVIRFDQRDKLKKLSIFEPSDIANCASILGFDKVQAEAFNSALTRDFTIIQGPPGTGKSYIASKLIQAILANRHIWGRSKALRQHQDIHADVDDAPVLVLAYKNQSLDHLVEKLYESGCRNIVRIGYTEHEVIKKSLLRELRRKNPGYEQKKLSAIDKEMRLLTKQIRQKGLVIQNVRTGLRVLGEELLEIMSYNHRLQFDEIVAMENLSYAEGMAKWARFRCYNSDIDLMQVAKRANLTYAKYTAVPRRNGNDRRLKELEKRLKHARRLMVDREDDADETEKNENYIPLAISSEGIDFLEENDLIDPRDINKLKLIQLLEKIQDDPEFRYNENEANAIENINQLTVANRHKLYAHWIHKYLQSKYRDLDTLSEKLYEVEQKHKMVVASRDVGLIKKQRPQILAMTLTGAAKYKEYLELIQPRQVIIEEAAEVLEPFLIAALTKSMRQVIMIGDHKQLRPLTTVRDLKAYRFDISLFERLATNQRVPLHTLQVQHRMRSTIADLIRPDIYTHLRDGPVVLKYPHVPYMSGKDVFFFQHGGTKNKNFSWQKTKTLANSYEAKFAMELANYLMLRGVDPKRITLLTAYNGQLHLFRTKMDYTLNSKIFYKEVLNPRTNHYEKQPKINVVTVDSFQGQENDIIIVSFVKNSGRYATLGPNDHEPAKNIGFLELSNRINVALSRARIGLYCFGDFEWYAEHSPLWASIVRKLDKIDAIGVGMEVHGCEHEKPTPILDADSLRTLNIKYYNEMQDKYRGQKKCRCTGLEHIDSDLSDNGY